MYHPKVTIAIPVYNGANFLAQAIDSALGQTYKNTEVIVVNDGSTDNGATDSVARRYSTQIRYIVQENKGVGGAMNAALAHITGDVFTWLSHDDIHLPEKVASQVEYYEKIGRKDAILFSDFYLINDAGEIWHETHLPFDHYRKTPMLPLLNGAINGCTLFIPARILREFGPFDETLRYVQDYDLWNRILSQHEFFLQPKPLVKYRIHAAQGTNNPQAAVEGDALWIRMLESRSETERVQLFGSAKKFFVAMTDFLDKTPYKGAATHARSRIETVASGKLVSVVVPFFNEIDYVLRAAHSVMSQTHKEVELILVDDGSTEDVSPVEALVASDARARLLLQENAGPGAARNHGMEAAQGDYIAFLDADDHFLPQKIEYQLGLMQDAGSVFSHTSYFVKFPGYFDTPGKVDTDWFTGREFPAAISSCPIRSSTVMLHASLMGRGFRFSMENQVGEELLTWIWVAQREDILGIGEPLSVIEWRHDSAAVRADKLLEAATFLLEHARADIVLSRYDKEVQQLKAIQERLADQCRTVALDSGSVVLGKLLVPEIVSSVFSINV